MIANINDRTLALIEIKIGLQRAILPLLMLAFFVEASISAAVASDGTWNLNPVDDDWSNTANWSCGCVPDGGFDTAFFDTSDITEITLSEQITVLGVIFSSGASAYTITCPPAQFFTLGQGSVSNESGMSQNFHATVDDTGAAGGFQLQGGVIFGSTIFTTEARATVDGSSGNIQLIINANAGSATFINKGGVISGAGGGELLFFDEANAGSATISNKAGTLSGASGGLTWFAFDPVNAGSAVITSEGATVNNALGGITRFDDVSTAGNATIIANSGSNDGGGGVTEFLAKSKGGSARIKVFGNGIMDMSTHDGNLSIGSLEGDGQVLLGGGNDLKVGNNNLGTLFSGTIQNSGSLTKVGSGTFTLSGANTYSSATTISGGALVASNRSGSATGTGPLKVSLGTLGGKGIIAGPVTIGTGSGAGAFLAPAFGSNKQVTLTLQSSLTFQADGTYTYTFRGNKRRAQSDQVIANTVTINGAAIAISGTTQGRMMRGTVLTVISNTSFNPINGTFSNLADGAVITVGSNNLQANYSGGDGNDLTLTVVP